MATLQFLGCRFKKMVTGGKKLWQIFNLKDITKEKIRLMLF